MQTPQHPTTDEMNELFIKACEYQQKGQLEAAAEKYRQLLGYVPEAPILLYNFGLVCYEQHKVEEALNHFSKALAFAPDDLDILYNVALCQKQTGDINAAINSYKQLLNVDPKSTDALYNLGGCYKDKGLHSDAVSHYLRVLELDGDHLSANNNIAYVYQHLGDTEKAIIHYNKVLDLQPDHQGARHMLSALTGKECRSSPDSYIRDVFDSYSGTYDQSLVGDLGYCVPDKLFHLLETLQWEKEMFEHGLDLGCGTGLSGQTFADKVKRFDGVDLSPKMIELAGAKKLYHNLESGNIVDYLENNEERYDFFLAADVLGYVGELKQLFSLIKDRSYPDTLFAFSTETTKQGNFILKPTGRFAHNQNYITEVARQTGWVVVSHQVSNLRKERGEWVQGILWFLKPC